MATKDWNKEGKNKWIKYTYNSNIVVEVWDAGEWRCYVYTPYKVKVMKIFKTKSAALKYAKAYMRKH